MFLVVHDVLQFLARLEIRNLLGGNFHPRAGLRVASDTGLALACAEAAESADFDLVAGPEGTYDAVENRLHDDFGFLSSHLDNAGDFFNQIGLRHRFLLDCKTGMKSQYLVNLNDLQAPIRGYGPSN